VPGYIFDVGLSRPTEGEFEAPSDALVVVFDSSDGVVKGLLSIGEIVEKTGLRAATSEVYDVVIDLIGEAVDLLRSELLAEEPTPGPAQFLEFGRGVVVVENDDLGIRPTWQEWGTRRVLSNLRADIATEAFLAMGRLPGFPVTRPGLRWYVCPKSHRHLLRIGAEGSPCPTCGRRLIQDD
jgi:hypothetical protein